MNMSIHRRAQIINAVGIVGVILLALGLALWDVRLALAVIGSMMVIGAIIGACR